MKNILFLLTFSIIVFSCTQEEVLPNESFLKIYDDEDYNANYKPSALGVGDTNIFMLSERQLDISNFAGINLIITDLAGEFKREQTLSDQYVAPTRDLIRLGSNHYFVCMDRNTLRPHLAVIDGQGEISFIALNLSTSYPLALNVNRNNELILLSYNQDDRQSVLSIISQSGSIVNQASYSIGAGSDVLEAITRHFTREQERLPFFCGEAPNGSYYFNGFYNYTLSMVFTSLGDDPTGVIQGQGVDAGFRHLLPIGANNYAFIAFQFEDHFLSGSIEFQSNNISSSVNYFDRKVPEIAPNANSKIIEYSYGTDELTIIASETEGRQVILYFYDKNTGNLINSQLLGTLNPFTFADIKVLEDGGIAILGTTFLADRFERIYLQKMSRSQIVDII